MPRHRSPTYCSLLGGHTSKFEGLDSTLPPPPQKVGVETAKALSGIYRIIHIESGKAYIGQAVNLIRRMARHRRELRSKYHYNLHLQRAFDKCGETSFAFEVIEYCSREDLTPREQFWMDSYGCGGLYNICKVAESVCGRLVSQATRSKISYSLSGRLRGPLTEEWKARLSHAHMGKKCPRSVAWQAKITASLIGHRPSDARRKQISEFFTHIPRTAQWRANISASCKGRVVSKERLQKMVDAAKAHIRTPNEILRRSKALSDAWVKRRLKT